MVDKTYYRAYNGCKSTIDLTLANLTIAPEYKWNKEYDLRGIGHFFIIIEDKREVSHKKKQRRILGRSVWYNFRKKAKLQQNCETKTQFKKHTTAKSKQYYKQQRKPSPGTKKTTSSMVEQRM